MPRAVRSVLLTRSALVALSLALPASLARAQSGDGAWARAAITKGVDSHSVVYDGSRQRLIAFGGRNGSVNSNDVFVLTLAWPPKWKRIDTVGLAPSPRNGQSAIYDPVRDRLIVFGGSTNSGIIVNEVWQLSLGGTPAWSMLIPPASGPSPPGRWGHVAVYDPVRDRMVVFGGNTGTTKLNDVWALSLGIPTTWTDLTPAGAAPPVRWGHAGVYDPVGDQLVIFGGVNIATAYSDTWGLSLSGAPAWSQLAPAGTPPSARWVHTAAYDAKRQQMLVFGGYSGSSVFNDVWALSLLGAPAWTNLTATGAVPAARWGTGWIYDPPRDRMVLFGGSTTTGVADVDDVWALSLAGGPHWDAVLGPAPHPATRGEFSAVHDPVGHRMFIIDGFNGSFLSDVWAMSLGDSPGWTPITPLGTAPARRHSYAATYDPVRNRIIVIGGVGDGGSTLLRYDDVWALSLTGTPAWTQLAPGGTPPAPIYGHSAIYDPVPDRIIVFGGVLTPGGQTNRVWSLSLAGSGAWTELTPAGVLPVVREFHSATYDPVRDRMLVFGGDGPPVAAAFADLWQLSLGATPTWTVLDPNTGVHRTEHTTVYDPVGDRLIVFGGFDDRVVPMNEAWSCPLGTGGGFTQLFPGGPQPEPRVTQGAIYDPDGGRMVMFGGWDALDDPDVWFLQLAAGTLSAPPVPRGDGIRLAAAHPNPADGPVTIDFSLPGAGEATLRVFDVSGRLVRTLVEGTQPAGARSVRWDRRTTSGAAAAPGVYLVELRAAGARLTRRVVLVRPPG